jgi:hypothetical protein
MRPQWLEYYVCASYPVLDATLKNTKANRLKAEKKGHFSRDHTGLYIVFVSLYLPFSFMAIAVESSTLENGPQREVHF